MGQREELIEKIRRQRLPPSAPDGEPLPVVSLEDFFTGNSDYGSIGCNVVLPPKPAPASSGVLGKLRGALRGPQPPELPGPAAFFTLFKSLRERDNVQDVLVEVREVEEADEAMWPFSDRIYVLTTASKEEVEKWFEGPLHPDEISEVTSLESRRQPRNLLPA